LGYGTTIQQDEGHRVVSVVDSDLAEKLDRVITWVDTNNIPGLARILSIPSLQTILLWIVYDGRSNYVVLESPYLLGRARADEIRLVAEDILVGELLSSPLAEGIR